MRCRLTASLRATATLALRSPFRLVSLAPQAGAPISAANLCVSENYVPTVGEGQVQAAMDRLETTGGAVLNDWLSGARCLQVGTETYFDAPSLVRKAAFDNSH